MRASSLFACVVALSAAPLAAQQAGAPAAPPATAVKAAPTVASGEPALIFDREVFSYAGGRRDPYTALVGKNDAGPRFEDLTLRGIIYSPAAGSMAVLSDGKRTYRKHRGELLGNARVVEISPTRVIFAVDNFGVWRQESLEMKKKPEGAKG